ncbi:glycosyltransferase [Rothia sp. ZJ1223]|uniref:glycosyltransferase n=1 Tax=Rothia sp. ZJ1223 TaxID=2811098 RepID=UPI001EF633FD|nr:glycosyltransferase [Rothia sp. ZJ1223]
MNQLQPAVSVTSSTRNVMTAPDRVVAVVVTYNRLNLLRLTLQGIENGAKVPDAVVIVDNASTDDTPSFLVNLETSLTVDVVRLDENTGGAGGFAVGIDRALTRHQADLVWVMDDDTEPTENTLSESYAAWYNYAPVRLQRPAVVASTVVWDNGQEHPMNTPRTMFAAGEQRHRRAQAVGARPIRSGSFVSLMMDAAVMRQYGLPLADFFIWNDDFEYSTALIRHSNGISVEGSVAKHHTKTFGTTNAAPGPRFYNDVRNKLWVFTRRRTLNPLEKFLYGGSTVRLWMSTMLNTTDKKTYGGYLAQGIKDALIRFRSNEQVLHNLYSLESTHPVELAPVATDFTVLMSVYRADTAEQLEESLRSNLVEQELKPAELVLVLDGLLAPDVEATIDRWMHSSQQGSTCPITLVRLTENAGLAAALTEGLRYCNHDIIARADADDVSTPQRFSTQIPRIAAGNLAVLGASMLEFESTTSTDQPVRQACTGVQNIRRVLRSRNPIMHPTVVFRKSAVESVGGYEHVTGAEDYWLWARLSMRGYRLDNLAQPLVRYRVGAGAYERRGGTEALRKDFELQHRLYTGGFLTGIQTAKNLSVRLVYRALPVGTRKNLYRSMIGRSFASTFRKGG